MFIRIFANVTGFGRFQLSQLGLILLDSRAVGDGDASRAELFIDAAQAGLGRFQVELVFGFSLVDNVQLIRKLLHLVVGRVHLVGGLILLQFIFGLTQFVFGRGQPLFQELAGPLLFVMAQFGQAVHKALDDEVIGLLGLFRRLAGDVDFQDFCIFIRFGNDVLLDIAIIIGQFPVFIAFFCLGDDRQDDVAALEDFRVGHHALLIVHGIAAGHFGQNRIAQALILLDAQQRRRLVHRRRDEQIGPAGNHEGRRNSRDFLLVGHDNLKEVFQINGYFFHPVQLLYGKY